MEFKENLICKDCGKTFSCLFGTNKESFSDFDSIFKNEYGEKAHKQLKELLNDIENNIEINIDDYNCFLEKKYDLEFKRKYLNKKLDNLAEQIEIQDKERKNKNSKFKFVAETFYWKYVEGFNDLKNIIESNDQESIEQAFNEKWVLFEGKRFGHVLFKCPKCNRYEAGFYTHVETADGKYECVYNCPKCDTPMKIYKGCISDAVQKNDISCQHCGSSNVLVKEGVIDSL